MKTLFVIGAGTMGGGIAQVAALHGFTVYLYDIKQEFVDKGLKGIAEAWDNLVERGKMAAGDRDTAPHASSARWTCRMPPMST